MDPREVGSLPGSRRLVHFPNATEKAKWLDAAASEDATDPHVRAFAARFLHGRSALREPESIVREIHRYIRDRIAYVHDWGGREELADTVTILRRAFDDCDGKARAFVALVRALGLPEVQARIRPVFKGSDFVHVQAEARWPGSGGWKLAEVIVRGVGLGDDPERTGERDARGRFVMAGPERSESLFSPRR